MGFFSPKAQCGICGKEVGLNRYKIRKSDAWCCSDCFKKASSSVSVNVFQMTIEDIKRMIEPKNNANTGPLNTAREMDEYAKERGYIYAGSTALKHFEVIEANLLPGEDVLMVLAPNGVYNGDQIVMGGITAVAFTNKRLIYGQKAIMIGAPVKIVNLDNINDVQKDPSGFVKGTICVDTLKEKICFQFTNEKLD